MKLTKKDKIEILIWVEALRSGLFNQIKYRLEDNLGYCCLGVACELFVENKYLNQYNNMDGNLPSDQFSNRRHWLFSINNNYRFKTGKYLTELNDRNELTFNQIADKIEETYLK